MWGYPYLSYVALGLIALIFVLGFFDPVVRTQLLLTGSLVVIIAIACKLRTAQKARSASASVDR